MSYYKGDFYQGDFYRGDPFFGGLFRAAVGVTKGLLGLGGGGASTAIVSHSRPGIGMLKAGAGKIVSRVGGIVSKHPVLSAAGAAGTIGVLGGGVAGRLSARHMGGKRHRRMRVTNPKALRRAIRRAQGFERLARRVMRFTSPHHKGRFAGFKRARKRK
jgi:hypothetical protein